MIITKDLVILNFGKTGSTFVRVVVLKILYGRINNNFFTKVLNRLKIKEKGYKEIYIDNPRVPGSKNQHGCFDQIPEEDKNKKILSVIRDPYSRLGSIYKQRRWARFPIIEKEKIEEFFPDFPELSIKQYIELSILENELLRKECGIDENLKIGQQTIEFIKMFFKNHEEVYRSLSEEYITSGLFKKDMAEVNFIKTENLNEELTLFLNQNGFSKSETSFINTHKKVKVAGHDVKKTYVDQDLISFVNETEWILFEILSSIGIQYKKD